MRFSAISEYEADIAALADRLRETPVGEIVTYVQLDEAIGRPVRAHRYLLLNARERVEKEDGSLYQAIFNKGLKRLPIESYASVGQQARKTIGRKARTAGRRLRNGMERANEVPAEVLRNVSREESVLALIQFAAKNKTMQKMLDEPITAPTPLARAAQDLMKALGVKMPE